MTRRRAEIALIVIAIVWGASFVLLKAALRDLSPLTLLGVRFVLAGLLLVPALRGASRAGVVAGLILGLLFWGGFVFQTTGLQYTTPSRSAFLTGLSVPLVPLIAWAVDRTRPGLAVVGGIVLALAGTWLLTDPGGAGLNKGDVLTLGCAVMFAAQIVAAAHYASRLPIWTLAAVEMLTTGVLSALAAPVFETPRIVAGPGTWLIVLFLVVTAVVTFGGQLAAQGGTTASRAALIFTLEPLAAALTSYLAFGELLTVPQWAGAALILAGTILPALTDRRPHLAAT